MTQPIPPSDAPGSGGGDPSDEGLPGEMSHPRLAPVMVSVALLMFLAMVALLCYRWLTVAEPNGFIEVQGTADFAGAQVKVEGDNMLPAEARLTSDNNFIAHFPLPAGNYRVSLQLDERVLDTREVTLREGSGVLYVPPLRILPTSRPATVPALPLAPTPL